MMLARMDRLFVFCFLGAASLIAALVGASLFAAAHVPNPDQPVEASFERLLDHLMAVFNSDESASKLPIEIPFAQIEARLRMYTLAPCASPEGKWYARCHIQFREGGICPATSHERADVALTFIGDEKEWRGLDCLRRINWEGENNSAWEIHPLDADWLRKIQGD